MGVDDEAACACKAQCPDDCLFKRNGQCKDACPDGCPLKKNRSC